jgi:16S rRNA processing protein RimM
MASASTRRLVALGAVMGAHGVRGELRVKPFNEDSELLPSLDELVLRHAGSERTCRVESVRLGSKGLIFALEEITTPEQAKALLGAELCVPRDALPPLAAGEYYFVDLPGLEVVHGTEIVGRVERVQEYPASSVLCVKTASGELEIPMREPYLVSVDVAAGRVRVEHLEDLVLDEPKKKPPQG